MTTRGTPTRFIGRMPVTDPFGHRTGEIEIRRLVSGELVGIDVCRLPCEAAPVYNPYAPDQPLDIAKDDPARNTQYADDWHAGFYAGRAAASEENIWLRRMLDAVTGIRYPDTVDCPATLSQVASPGVQGYRDVAWDDLSPDTAELLRHIVHLAVVAARASGPPKTKKPGSDRRKPRRAGGTNVKHSK